MKFHYAKVLNNVDPKFQGRVQVKVEYLMDEFSNDMCPWALPFKFSMGGMTLSHSSMPFGSMTPPKKDSMIWIFFADEKNMKHPLFFADVSLPAMNLLHSAKVVAAIQAIINTTIALAPPALTVTYPDLYYTLYPNGLVVGLSAGDSNADCFVMNINAGSFISMNTTGGINIKGTTVSIQGATGLTVPNPSGKGGFCALPNCLFTGAPHQTETIS